jgi:hypothetical protein
MKRIVYFQLAAAISLCCFCGGSKSMTKAFKYNVECKVDVGNAIADGLPEGIVIEKVARILEDLTNERISQSEYFDRNSSNKIRAVCQVAYLGHKYKFPTKFIFVMRTEEKVYSSTGELIASKAVDMDDPDVTGLCRTLSRN